jgi:hypothetical protein
MFNPLAPFSQQALDGFLKKGYKFFVRQTFNRGNTQFENNLKRCFLFCHYDNYFSAKEHFDALSTDVCRYLYNWNNVEDREKLKIAASQPEGYKIYTNTFSPDWENHVTDRIKVKIRAYVQKLGWKPAREEAIHPVFYPHFGEVYVSLKYRGREVRVKFEEIEKIT